MQERIKPSALPGVMALAYIGDSRHSLYIRRMLVKRGLCKSGDLNEASLSYVTAQAQAEALRRIEPSLSDEERAVYRRASNSGHLNKPRHASLADYRAATGFEAVIGMLYWLDDEERIEQLLTIAYADDNDITTGETK